MTFSGQQPNQRNVEDTDNFKAIVSGGLNTNGNRLLMSGDDSPNLYNVEVTSSGALAKRRGFKQQYPFNTWTGIGSVIVPFRGFGGTQFYLVKTEDDLQIIYRDEVGTWQGAVLSGVFPVSVSDKRPDFCVISEPGHTRIVFVQENMVPIQAVITETTVSSTIGAPGTVFRATYDTRYTPATAGNEHFAFIGGVHRDVTSFSVFSGQEFDLDVAGADFAAGTYSINLVSVAIQFWSEAIRLDGDQILGQEVQSTATKHVPVPERVRKNISELYLGLYPIRVYSATTYGTYFTRVTNLTPTLNTEYTFSNGVDSSPNRTVPTSNWITFGAVPASTRTVTFHRYHVLPFSSRPDADLLEVVGRFNATNGFSWNFSGSVPPAEGGAGVGGTSFSYGLVTESAGTLTTVVAGTTTVTPNAYAIRFDQTSTANGGIAIPQDDYYSVIVRDIDYLQSRGYLGAYFTSPGIACAGLQTLNEDNAAYPAYGIWEASDYGAGSYPSTICMVQNRVVLAGFPNDPMRVLISAVGDTTIPGEYFNNWQIFYEDGEATDPLDVQLPGRGDDIVLCVREFQSSLFAFTRYNVFRITGGDGAIAPTSVFSSRISTLGTVNALSVVPGNNTLYFLNAQGVFSLTATDDAGGYTTEESSVKIKNLFRQRPYIEVTSYMCFDPENNRLYVGLSDSNSATIANQLFVYQVDRDAWFIWTDDGGDTLRSSHAAIPSLLTGLESPVFLFARDTFFSMFSMYEDRFSDVLFSTTLTTPTSVVTARRVTHTTELDVNEYYTVLAGGAPINSSFSLFPLAGYQDCDVYLSGNLLTWGVDYVKTDRSSIILTTPVGAGLTLVIEHKWRYEDVLYHPISVYEDNRWVEPTQYTTTIVSDRYRVAWDMGYTPTGTISFCVLYPAFYITPTFTRSRISTHKRQFHYYGYYDNSIAGRVLKSSDVTAKELVGTRKHDLDFDVAFVFNSESWAETSSLDIYGFETLHWDYGHLEFGSPEQGQKEFSRIVVPIIGAGYGFQTAHVCFSAGTFQLVGYEIRTRSRRSRGFSYVD